VAAPATVTKLRVVPSIPAQCRTRPAMKSRPSVIPDSGPDAPIPSMLLSSMCDAWHDIGERTKALKRKLVDLDG